MIDRTDFISHIEFYGAMFGYTAGADEVWWTVGEDIWGNKVVYEAVLPAGNEIHYGMARLICTELGIPPP